MPARNGSRLAMAGRMMLRGPPHIGSVARSFLDGATAADPAVNTKSANRLIQRFAEALRLSLRPCRSLALCSGFLGQAVHAIHGFPMIERPITSGQVKLGKLGSDAIDIANGSCGCCVRRQGQRHKKPPQFAHV